MEPVERKHLTVGVIVPSVKSTIAFRQSVLDHDRMDFTSVASSTYDEGCALVSMEGLTMPRVAGRLVHCDNVEAVSASQYYQRLIFFSYINGLSSSLQERFNDNPSFFVLLSILPPNDPSNIDQIDSLYALDNLANEVPQNITIQGNKITNQQQILEEFNNFFSKIGEKLASKFDTNDEELFKRFLSSRVAPSIFLEPPRVNEVIVAINSLNFYKSFGHDDIPPFFLRTACCVLAPTLGYFVDNAFRLGIFPRSCKIAKIVPLFKTRKTEELTNYRPISILTCFSKIFEKLIYSRLISFFQKNTVLHDSQYGFRNGMSTTHAVLDVLTSTCDQINNEQYTGLMLLEFKKAFDTVCHWKLLHKLEYYGIRGEALKLLHSFLSNRQQFVSFQNLSSKTLANNYGVPQGSNLGPSLFLIYINDIPNALNLIPRLFADDTCLVIHSANPGLLRNNIIRELQKIHI